MTKSKPRKAIGSVVTVPVRSASKPTAKVPITTLRIVRRHTRNGRCLPPGSRLELPGDEAKKFIEHGWARVERDDERGAADPGIDCWGLRAVKSGLIHSVLSELLSVTEYASQEIMEPPKLKQYLQHSMDHCMEAWRLVGNAERKCRALLGVRPTERELQINTPPKVLALQERYIEFDWYFSGIRKEVALAQNALNAGVYPEMRPGRKPGTETIARGVLRVILLEIGANASIGQVFDALLDAAAKGKRVNETSIKFWEPGDAKKKLQFEKGRWSNKHTRGRIEKLLVEVRKSLEAEAKHFARMSN